MAVDIQKMMAGKMQMEAAIQAEVRQTARDLFVRLAGPYLEQVIYRNTNSDGGPRVGPDGTAKPHPLIVKAIAGLAMKCAPYLHQAAGMVQIDDEKHWGKVEVTT
jgi:hypothetical protein